MLKALAAAILVAGCTPDVSPDVPGGIIEFTDGDMQGTHLLGDQVDTLGSDGYFFWVGSQAHQGTSHQFTVHVDPHGVLVAVDNATHTGFTAAADLDGMEFESGTAKLRVKHVDNSTGTFRYELEYWDSAEGYVPYCNEEIATHALAMQGRWTKARRDHVAGPQLSFGCEDSGVSAKCREWGYNPGSDSLSDAWSYHQACTVMANANYCRTGPKTHELTPIEMRDFWSGSNGVGSNKGSPHDPEPLVALDPRWDWPPADGTFWFEAAWRADSTVACMTRARWESLGSGGYCPTDVPDPRETASAVFCEDLTFEALTLPPYNALMFDSTPQMDMALVTWDTGAPNYERVTTVNGYIDGTITVPPFRPAGYRNPLRDAILLRTLTGALTVGVDVVEVYDQTGPSDDRVVAPLDALGKPMPGYTADAREGYLFTSKGPGKVAFNLYSRPMGSSLDYVSATRPPTSGYKFERLLGYAILP